MDNDNSISKKETKQYLSLIHIFTADYSGYNATDYTRTKCNLYFKKKKTVNTVLGNIEVYEYTPDFTKSACDDATCESHEKGIFETTDDDGVSY